MLRETFSWRRQVLCLLPLLVLVALLFTCLQTEDGVEDFFTLHRRAHRQFERVVEFYSDYGNVPFYLVYGYLLVQGLRLRRKDMVVFAMGYVCALGATLYLTEGVKHMVGRPRPPVDGDFLPFSLVENDDYQSFPSGHVTETLFTVSPLMQLFRNTLTPLLFGLVPALMGLSRIYLGEHHPTDMLGAAALGSLCAYLCWWITRFLMWLTRQRQVEAVLPTVLDQEPPAGV